MPCSRAPFRAAERQTACRVPLVPRRPGPNIGPRIYIGQPELSNQQTPVELSPRGPAGSERRFEQVHNRQTCLASDQLQRDLSARGKV